MSNLVEFWEQLNSKTKKPKTSTVAKEAQRGFPLMSIVFLIFLTLKLAGIGEVATWSWWWVWAPIWGPFAFVIGMMGILFGFVIVASLIAGIVWLIARGWESLKK